MDAETRAKIEELLHEVTEVRPGYDLAPKVKALAEAVRILADTVFGEAPAGTSPVKAPDPNAGFFG